MSRPFLDRAERTPSSPDPDTATAQTVELMCEQIARAVRDPVVQAAAKDALQFRGGPLYKGEPGEHRAIAASVWWWCYTQLRFVHHEPMIRALFNEQDQLQLLISPDVLLRTKKPAGDCAVYTSLVCALLKANGIPFEIVTVACEPSQPSIFTHVYARAVLSADGTRLPLDASHGKYPGWEVPRAHALRKQVWNEDGRPVADQACWQGLHGYTRRGMGACGFDPQSGEQWCSPDTGAGGGGWTALIQSLANQWTQIGGRVIAPQTSYQRGTGGQVLLTTPGSAPIFGSELLASTTGGGSALLWVGGGLVALLVVASIFKGKR